ncbi:MAG: rod shape-determining protein MreC [Patescibacteria group bacterium]
MKKISFLIFFSVLIIIFSLLFFKSKGSFSSVDSGVTRVFQPVGMVFVNSTGWIKDLFSNIGNIGNLQKENKELRSRINELESESARMAVSEKENEALKRELNFKHVSGFETITAQISFFDPTNIRESIIIDKGANDGVKEKMAATAEGFLIGRVAEVYSNSSKIILITDPMSNVPAQIPEVSATGIVQGQVGIGLTMNQVPQETELKKGQAVVTSGLGGEYPKGLVIGKVENITKKNNSIFQTASLRTLIDFKSLERVQLIKE